MTTEQQKRPIKRLRAALVEIGFTNLGGYKEYKGVFALYAGEYGQQRIINAAKRLGFKNAIKSGPTSVALPKRKKSKAVIKKNTGTHATCVVMKKHIKGLFNGITPQVRIEIVRSIIKKLDPKDRKAFILSLSSKRVVKK
jgi:hypothetical protein